MSKFYIKKIDQYAGLVGKVFDTLENDSTVDAPSIHAVNGALDEKADKIVVLNEDGTEVIKEIDLGFKLSEEEGNVDKGQLIDKATKKPLYTETEWGKVTNKPPSFPPSTHKHTKAEITDMPTKLSQFTNDSNYQTETQVKALINALVNSAPETLDTLKEVAEALGNDPNFATTITNMIGTKASTDYVNTELAKKIDKTGDASNVTTSFTQATERQTIISGEKLSITLGKLKKWFADFKTVAFTGKYTDLTDIPTEFTPKAHNHSASNITSGTLPIARGGTGATTAPAALLALGVKATADELNYMDGVTSNVQTQLNGKSPTNHNHDTSYSKIIDGLGKLLTNIPMTPPQNLLINGDFQIWQRGTEITVQNGEYLCDMWRVYCGEWAQAVKFKKVDNGLQVVDFISANVDTPQCNIYQYQEYQPYLTGKKWIKQKSINGKIQIETGTYSGDESGKSFIGNVNSLKKGDIVNFVRVDLGEIAYPHQKEDHAVALTRAQKTVYLVAKGIYSKVGGVWTYYDGFLTSYIPNEMFERGNVIVNARVEIYGRSDGNENKATDITEAIYNPVSHELKLKPSDTSLNFRNGITCLLQINTTDGYILISAEKL